MELFLVQHISARNSEFLKCTYKLLPKAVLSIIQNTVLSSFITFSTTTNTNTNQPVFNMFYNKESRILLFKQGSSMLQRLVVLIQSWEVWLSILGSETNYTVRFLLIFPQPMESGFGFIPDVSRMPLIFMVYISSLTHLSLCPSKRHSLS